MSEQFSTGMCGFGNVDEQKDVKGDIELRDDGYWICIITPWSHTEYVEGGHITTQGGQYMKISRLRAWCLMALKVLN